MQGQIGNLLLILYNNFNYCLFFLVRLRAIPINTEMKPFDGAITIYMLDPHRHIMKRWLSRQSTLGTVSLDYQLSDQPVFGMWTIQVIAQGQIEEATFNVEEYYQTRFEVKSHFRFKKKSILFLKQFFFVVG